MESKSTEIEIKIRVHDSAPLLKFLQEKGNFESEKHQRDEYFSPPHRDFIKAKPIKEWFRLREEESECSMNYKNWHYGDDGKGYYCDEHEVKIDTPAQARNILKALNFKPLINVDKKRRIFTFQDYEIALDSVNELGDFIEVEYKGENRTDVKKIAGEMKTFIEGTGCKILEQDFAGYPALLLKKNHGLQM
jgi:adenylate cyclase, class 2